MSRPNVVWFSTHDINPDLGCYSGVWPGADYAHTPNLDRLAAEGARFDRAFAAAPVCAPARSAIMTGCFPNAIGTMHMRTKAVPPSEVKLLPQYFREAGYYCTNNYFTDFQVDVPPTVFDDCSPTAHWRNRPDEETPFFAAFHGMTTHESQIYLDEESFQLATSHVASQQRHDLSAAPLPPYYPDTELFRRAWARYADLITEMDHWVGGILDQLEEDGLVENTIVVFWSDHGRGMPRAKRWATEAGLRVPLIMRWPGVLYPGSVRTDLVHTMDLAPTMLEASGLGVPAHMHGMSLLGRDGTFNEPNLYVYAGRDRMDESEDTSRTVRDERYRYVYLQCIQSIDDNVGRLLDHLDERGLSENTLVVYTSDQGFFLGDHGWFDKRLMFDQSLQMPMLMKWPAEITAGSRCEAIITNVDFAATFLDIAGINADDTLPTSQGRSFRPLLRGEDIADWPDAAYYRYWEHDDPIHAAPGHYGIRTADYKLIHYYNAGLAVPGSSDHIYDAEWELYDLQHDPTEVRNVADDPSYARIRSELEQKLAEYQQHYQDEPYMGPGTPHPQWGPHDEGTLERVEKYVEALRASS